MKHIGNICTETKKQIATDMIAAAKKGESPREVALVWAGRLGRNIKTVYRYAKSNGYKSGRKPRADRGVSPDLERHLLNIFHIYHRRGRKNGNESSMSIETAVTIYLNELSSQGITIELPSISWIQQIGRRWQVSRRDAKRRTPHIDLVSTHSNEVHQLDFSVCRYYLDKKAEITNIGYISKSQEYKNKSFTPKGKRRLVRMVLIDHATGAFFVQYTFQQRIEDIAEFLYQAWKNKGDDFIFHGAPEKLIIDNDVALHSHAMLRLFAYLEIEIPAVEVEAPRVKGTVEGFMRIWESWFEMQFLFQKSGSLEEINKWAYDFSILLQQTRKHRRHGMTRFAAWDGNIGEHLRELPEKAVYQQMLYSEPKQRTVKPNGMIEFKGPKGHKYRVTDQELFGFKVDVYVHPYLYQETGAITIQFPPQGTSLDKYPPGMEIKTYTITPEFERNLGFAEGGTHWGDYAPALEPTQSEQRFKQIEEAPIGKQVLMPFNAAAGKIKKGLFPPRIGKKIQATPDITGGPQPLSKIKAKQHLAGLLGRNLTPEDIRLFDQHLKGRTVFEADVNALAQEIKTQEKQKEA